VWTCTADLPLAEVLEFIYQAKRWIMKQRYALHPIVRWTQHQIELCFPEERAPWQCLCSCRANATLVSCPTVILTIATVLPRKEDVPAEFPCHTTWELFDHLFTYQHIPERVDRAASEDLAQTLRSGQCVHPFLPLVIAFPPPVVGM
jgi:hypothetical protein